MPKPKPSLPLLLRDDDAALTADNVQELFAYTDRQARVSFDARDSAHDHLFGAIMARVDALQAEREAYLQVIARVKRQVPLWPFVLQQAGRTAEAMLDDAKLLADDARKHAQIAGVLAVMGATFHAWQTDTSTDLSATLRACDTSLRRGATIAAWLGFV